VNAPGFSLDIADDGLVRWLTISNPQRRNAITVEGFDLLAEAFEDFEASACRALVITGAGDHFSAGADLSGDAVRVSDSAADNLKVMAHPAAAATALYRITKATVAAVDGIAVGAGMNLALGCDVVVATERARFAEIFVRRGLALDFGGTWLLPRLVGLARARDLALTGREVSGAEALEIGLIAQLAAPDRLRSAAAAIAAGLAEGAPLAQQFIKSGLSRSSSMTFEQSLRFEDQAQAVLLGTEDFAEGVDAFLTKRPPDFRGR
jgi:2-(1,2-epoxy-1,2-dihydrophenyl)acetyl-CoA isomerase